MTIKKEAETIQAAGDARTSAPGGTAKECGLIMPISSTKNYDESHWRDVQKLLHRGISAAGFIPVNVWTNEATDRISERVVGNIFNKPIVVADISDLNPNVMFELGLRISSKKPTIIVCCTGSEIPFDIHDFNIIFYPNNLNILGMEKFFADLIVSLKNKIMAFEESTYVPFLSNVIVDVLSPTTRETTAEEIIIRSLGSIEDRLSKIENPTPRVRFRTRPEPRFLIELKVKNLTDDQVDDLELAIDERPTLISNVLPEADDEDWRVIEVRNHSETSMNAMAAELRTLIAKAGLTRGNYRMRLIDPSASTG